MTERNCLGPGWLVRATAAQSWQGQLMSGGRGCAAQQCLHSLSLHQWLRTAAALLCRPLGAMWTRVCRSMFSEWCRPGWLGALLSGESWQGNVAMLPFTCVRIFAHSVGCSVQQLSLSFSLPLSLRFFKKKKCLQASHPHPVFSFMHKNSQKKHCLL